MQASPPLQAAHPGDSLEPSSSVFGVGAPSATSPWSLDAAVPAWPGTGSTGNGGSQPAGQPASSSSFLSPLPLPNLSLGPPPPAPAQDPVVPKPDPDASHDHDGSNAALRALMGQSPLLGPGSPPSSAEGQELGRSGDGGGAADGRSGETGGDAQGDDHNGAPSSFADMPAATYAHLLQQARFFGPASNHSSPAALESAGTSASLAPASTYISAPPSGASTPAPPGSAGGSADQGGLSGSLAAAAAQYGLPLSLHPQHHSHHFGSPGPQKQQQQEQQQQHHFAPPLSLHLNQPSSAPSPGLAFAPPPSFAPAPAHSHAHAAQQAHTHAHGHSGVGHDRPISDTEESDADGSSESGASSGSESDDDDAPVPYAAHAHLQGVVQDHFTPATSAHHSDHEKAPSPPGGGPLLYGIAPPHAGGTPGGSSSFYPGGGMTGAGEAYDPGAPYIPFLRPSSLSSASSRSLSAGTRAPASHPHYASDPSGALAALGGHHPHAAQGVTYRDDEPPELPYASDDSADGDFGRRKGVPQQYHPAVAAERGRGRTRTRKPSAAALAAAQAGQAVAGLGALGLQTQAGMLGFAAPRPPPAQGQQRSASAASASSSAAAGPSGSGSGRKRHSPGADAVPSAVSGPGASIDPLTGYPRRQTEIPAVEDDPSIRPYGCNWCRLERGAGSAAKGKARAEGNGEEHDDDEETSWRTIRELREHAQRAHKERTAKAKQDDDEAVMMEMPFCCALDPCGKTFSASCLGPFPTFFPLTDSSSSQYAESLAGLRFHFQNASANGHFFVQLERDAATGEERATKKFKQEVKPSGRELKCPVGRCPKRFKQSAGAYSPEGLCLVWLPRGLDTDEERCARLAGLAYHLSHTPNHPITEAMLATFEPTLQSKTRWWFGRLNKAFDK